VKLYAVSRDGTLDGIEWRVGLPLIRTTPDAARREKECSTFDPNVSEGWSIIEVELEFVAVAIPGGQS